MARNQLPPWRGAHPGALRFLIILVLALGLFTGAGCTTGQARLQAEDEDEEKFADVPTVGEVAALANMAPTAVSGVGLVTGLDGTGGGTPPSQFRTWLEEDLRKRKVQNVREVLESPDNAVVLISAVIPPGIRKGEPLDIEVTLPPNSKVTSLRGGYLQDCALKNYSSTRTVNPEYQGSDKLIGGHILARARGRLLVGLGAGTEDEGRLRRGRIWEGGVSLIDVPFYLVLNNDQKFARVTNAVVERINTVFQDDPKKRARVWEHRRLLMLDEVTSQINHQVRTPSPGRREMAKAATREVIHVSVPWDYRLNAERYLRVVMKMPLRETPDSRGPYRQKLQEMLLDPARTVQAAHRLEALGKESIPVFKTGLQSEYPLVQFCCAESLAYLGSPAGVDVLARMAEEHPQVRAYCFTALASLDELVVQNRLGELLASANPETRYGAFRALQVQDENAGVVKAEQDIETFNLHRVALQGPPLIHVSLQRRPEVVIFGATPKLVPPFNIRAGKEFTITAAPDDNRCTVTRYNFRVGKVSHPEQCALEVDAVLRTMAEFDAQYPDVVDFLRQVDQGKHLSCQMAINASPQALTVEELAVAGRDRNFLKTATTAETPAVTRANE